MLYEVITRHRQPETVTARSRREVRVENPIEVLRADANAIVLESGRGVAGRAAPFARGDTLLAVLQQLDVTAGDVVKGAHDQNPPLPSQPLV